MTPTILVAIALLVGVSAFFSGSEIAVFSLEDHRLDGLAAEPGGAALTRLREDPHRLLVTVLVGNNVVNVAIASLTTALFVGRVGGGAGVVLATVFASTVVLLFGEIVPKSYGVAHPERVALRVAGPIRVLQVVLYPVVAVFEVASGAINHLTGGTRDIERPYVTREEIVALVETAEALGIVEADEQAMIDGSSGSTPPGSGRSWCPVRTWWPSAWPPLSRTPSGPAGPSGSPGCRSTRATSTGWSATTSTGPSRDW